MCRTWKLGDSVPLELIDIPLPKIQIKNHLISFLFRVPVVFYQVEAANGTETVHLDWMRAIRHCREIPKQGAFDQSEWSRWNRQMNRAFLFDIFGEFAYEFGHFVV